MIYFKYLRMVIKTMLQYRLNLLLTAVGQFANAFFMFAGIYLLFERFERLDDWTFGEVAVCYGVVIAAYSLTVCFARGFDVFQNYIRQGTFDRVLLRPRNTVLQIVGANFEFGRLINLVWAFAVLAAAVNHLGQTWTALRVVTLLLMIVSGFFVFSGIFILGATMCFWTVDGLEVVNIFTDGGKELTAYPLTIYSKWLRRFFTFVIPFGAFNYLPLMYVTGRADNPLYTLTPLLGIVFIIPCLLVWRVGVTHYLSTGN
jgi:ABC-2 type transport system permease protein